MSDNRVGSITALQFGRLVASSCRNFDRLALALENEIGLHHPNIYLVDLQDKHAASAMPDTRPSTPPPSSSIRVSRPPQSSPYLNVPTTARMRHPAAPSPLSKCEPTLENPRSISAMSSPDHKSLAAPSTSALAIPEASPCFIHSHLDRHGSLQDWLKNKSANNRPHFALDSPTSSKIRSDHGQHHHTNTTEPVLQSDVPFPSHQRQENISSPPSASQPSSPRENVPPTRKGPLFNGYDSDQSSMNEYGTRTPNLLTRGNLLGDGLLEGDEEGNGSLTRQLAETAQGVREMSKELGGSCRLISSSVYLTWV